MCFSQFAQYTPRPVKEYAAPERPEGAPLTKAELDPNLFGPKPVPPEWQQSANAPQNGHSHDHGQVTNGTAAPAAAVYATTQGENGAAVTSVTTQTVEAVVVELSNGTKLLICPL